VVGRNTIVNENTVKVGINKDAIKIGFIGVGYMGYGMAHNLLKNNYSVSVIAHKNRKPIDRLIDEGAIECKSMKELGEDNNVIVMCVTNTPIATEIANEIVSHLNEDDLVIDITTHQVNGSIEIEKIFSTNKVNYVESPVMGGPVQSKEGVLGAIVGSSDNNFILAKEILLNFCKKVVLFGPVGNGTKAKLINNFLSLGTATLVIETLKAIKHLNIDLQKFYDVAKLGSGNSGALNRITDKAIAGDYKGYIFSVNNTLKDMTYINELLSDLPNAEKLSSLTKSFYQDAADRGEGDLLISELINKA
jgi:3-hydroxyisobutyrate dehydrogenase-like beta-hydroxyacid dehydrogenase